MLFCAALKSRSFFLLKHRKLEATNISFCSIPSILSTSPRPPCEAAAGDKIKTKSRLAVQRCNHREDVLAREVYAVSVAAALMKVWTAAVHSAKVRRERYKTQHAVFHYRDVKNTRPFLVRPLHVFFHLNYFYLSDPRRALYCLV